MKRKIIDLDTYDEEESGDADEDPEEEEVIDLVTSDREEESGDEEEDDNDDNDDNEEQEEEEPSSGILDWFMGLHFMKKDLLQRMQPSSSSHLIDYSDRFQLLDGTAYQESHDDAYTRFILDSAEDDKVKESILYRLRSVSTQKDKTKRFELSSSRGGLVFVAIKSAASKEMEAGVAKVMQCAVCLSIMIDPCTLPCGHSGCLGCLESCFSSARGRKCPHCKDAVDIKLKLKVNITLRDSIAIMAPHHVANRSASSGDGNYNALCFQSSAAAKMRKAVRKHPKSFQDLDESEEQDDSDGRTAMEEACYRLCRRAGVIFEDENVYDELRAGMGSFIELVTKRIHVLMDNSSEEDDDEEEEAEDAVVICADDVIAALRDQHIASTLSACQVYGFGGRYGLRHAFSETILAIVGRGSVTHIDPIALSVMNDLLADFLFMLHDRAVQFGRSDAIIGYLAKVRAGPTNEADVCDGSAHVSLYIEAEHCGEFGVVPKVSESVHLISDASVRKALTALLFPTALELCKNAISSGRDAISSALLTSSYVNQSLDVSGAGLQLVPQHLMRLCSERSPFKGTYSVHAAVYLAGAVQYLCEEIVDVAQLVIAEQDANCFEITSRHILLGIRDDSELNSLFPGAIRAGGVQPGTAIAPPYGSWKDMATEDDEEGVAVTRMLVQKARAQAVRDDSDIVLGVDPRDGRHFYYHHNNNNSKAPIIINGAAETAVDRIYPAPLADTFCQVEAAKRRAAAIAALSAKEGAIYRSFEESNNSIDINNDDDEEQEGDDDESIETLRSLYKIRLREIRYEQSSPQPVFHPADFARALQEASSNTHDDVRWTDEAAQVMQVACEYHLLQLCNSSIQLTGEASLNNRHLRKLKYILSL